MKRFILSSALVSALALPAMAQAPVNVGGPIGNGTNANQQTGVNAAISTGSIGSTSSASGGAGGAGGQGGSARGGAARVTNNIGNGSGGLLGSQPSTIRNTPNSTLALGTAYCQNSGGVTGSGPGFSFGAAFGKHDRDCKRYNFAIALAALGDVEAAKLVLANDPEVNAALVEAARQRAAVHPAPHLVAMHPAGPRDPRPSRADCVRLRRLPDPTQVQRDYLVANCGR